MNPKPARPARFEVRYAGRFKHRARRRDMRHCFWGTWLILIVAIGLGRETLAGFASGDRVDIGVRFHPFLVPWWLAAALTAVTLLVSLWCFTQYATLKARQPKVQPGDEEDEDA